MPTSILKRSRADDRTDRRPSKKVKKIRKQLEYHSSSDEDEELPDFQAVNLQDSDEDEPAQALKKAQFVVEEGPEDAEDATSDNEGQKQGDGEGDGDDGADAASATTGASDGSDAQSEVSETSTAVTEGGTRKKRNDPAAFATSISKILSSKLTTSKRSDPVLSRSASTQKLTKDLAESKLEARARQKIRAERKLALEKGRVRDVLGLESTEESTQAIMEREARLKKTAQRGVVKLFNAVREAQKRGEMERKKSGAVGRDAREEGVREMSKQGFLDLIAEGGKKSVGA